MPGRILVAYASKSNATAIHAAAIAGALRGAGRDADMVDLREAGKPDLGPYSAVVVGSGVRIGRWYGPARRLLKRKELATKRVALFVACGMLAEDQSKCADAVRDYVDKVAAKRGLAPVSARAFPGHMPDGKSMKLGRAEGLDTGASAAWGAELAVSL